MKHSTNAGTNTKVIELKVKRQTKSQSILKKPIPNTTVVQNNFLKKEIDVIE